jgi:hypothetical protein
MGEVRPDVSDHPRFDAATLQVLWTRLIACVDEAAAALVRTSFSTLVRESHDFSCVITDELGQSLVQATRSIPSFIGTLPATAKHFIREFPPETLYPNDVLITNDLFQGTGHLPDVTVAKPIYFQGQLVGFAASTAHAPDIGGNIRSPQPREVYEEGFQIPIMKLQERVETKPDETPAQERAHARPNRGGSLGPDCGLGYDGSSGHGTLEVLRLPEAQAFGRIDPGPMRQGHAPSHLGASRRGLPQLSEDGWDRG